LLRAETRLIELAGGRGAEDFELFTEKIAQGELVVA
jgi:hypothetical protein